MVSTGSAACVGSNNSPINHFIFPGVFHFSLFRSAIQGADPSVDQPIEAEEKPGLVDGCVWAFCSQRKGDQQGDYHKVFNSENFIQ
jgi:hypothetical protein